MTSDQIHEQRHRDATDEPAVVRRAPRHAAHRRFAAVLVAVIVAVVVACRAWVASAAIMPKGPDVLGPWAAAFSISGASPSIDMHDLPPYSVGMGALLSPLVPLIEDPQTRYRISVVLLGLLVLVAGWLVRRALDDGSGSNNIGLALAFATTIGLTAVAFSSAFTWAEPLALLWLAGWLILLGRSVARPSRWAVVWAGLYSSTALLVHGRLTLVPAAWVLTIAVFALLDVRAGRRRPQVALGEVALGALVAAVGFVVTRGLRMAVIADAWSAPNLENDTQILSNVGKPSFWFGVLLETTGQLWYLGASTAGLAFAGIWFLVAAAFGRHDLGLPQGRRVAGAVLATLAGILAISVLFTAGALVDLEPSRLDYLVYGRYADQVGVVLAAVGISQLVKVRSTILVRVMAGSVVLLGVSGVVVRMVRDRIEDAPVAVNEAVISGVAALPFDRPGLDITRWTMLGVAAASILVIAGFTGRRTLAASVVVLLALGTVAGSTRAVQEHRAWDNSVLYEGYPDAPAGASRAVVPKETLGGMAYRFNFPSQQYALGSKGWHFEVVPETSAEVAVTVEAGDGMVVFPSGYEPPSEEWCHLPGYDRIVAWVRRGVVTDGAPAGACEVPSG